MQQRVKFKSLALFAAIISSSQLRKSKSLVISSFNGDSMDVFKGLRITQLDDDDDDNVEAPVEPINVDDEFDDDDEEDEEDCEPVILGFVETPKFEWSSLRQLFPNLAGGVPVTMLKCFLSICNHILLLLSS